MNEQKSEVRSQNEEVKQGHHEAPVFDFTSAF
jgi:hypothetical protein